MKFPAPPITSEFPNAQLPKTFSLPWIQWFQALTNKLNPAPLPVTGSRASGAALQSLLAQLTAAGIIKDNTTV